MRRVHVQWSEFAEQVWVHGVKRGTILFWLSWWVIHLFQDSLDQCEAFQINAMILIGIVDFDRHWSALGIDQGSLVICDGEDEPNGVYIAIGSYDRTVCPLSWHYQDWKLSCIYIKINCVCILKNKINKDSRWELKGHVLYWPNHANFKWL